MAFASVNGVDLHYDEIDTSDQVTGERPGQVMVWGHGFLYSAELYHPIIKALPGYRHIAVDFRGHGRSAGIVDDATVSRMADDTWQLLDQLDIERFIYVGHSMGNAVGMRLVSRHPDAVIAAVSLAGVPLVGMPESTRELNKAVASLCGQEEALAAALGTLFVHPDMDAVIKASGASAALVQSGPISGISQTELYLNESAELLPGLTQPWLFLIPAEDAAIPAEAQLVTARAIEGARAVWLNGEGHIFPQERPQETAAYITAFLSTVAGRPVSGTG